jgi:hypothetical protein
MRLNNLIFKAKKFSLDPSLIDLKSKKKLNPETSNFITSFFLKNKFQ